MRKRARDFTPTSPEDWEEIVTTIPVQCLCCKTMVPAQTTVYSTKRTYSKNFLCLPCWILYADGKGDIPIFQLSTYQAYGRVNPYILRRQEGRRLREPSILTEMEEGK